VRDPASRALAILIGSVWHTTIPERYASICADGFIRAEPSVPDAERWGTAAGPEGYPYVRSLGGVSLFEFREFDPGTYSSLYPVSSWRSFVPCCGGNEESVWMEIDVAAAGPRFVGGRALLQQWKEERASRRLMPLIEACHIGDLPVTAARRVLNLTRSGDCVRLDLSAPLAAGRPIDLGSGAAGQS